MIRAASSSPRGSARSRAGLMGGCGGGGTKGSTLTAIHGGGRRWSTVVAALGGIALVLFLRPVGNVLPISVLAGAIIHVGFHMLDWRIIAWLRTSKARIDGVLALAVVAATRRLRRRDRRGGRGGRLRPAVHPRSKQGHRHPRARHRQGATVAVPPQRGGKRPCWTPTATGSSMSSCADIFSSAPSTGFSPNFTTTCGARSGSSSTCAGSGPSI